MSYQNIPTTQVPYDDTSIQFFHDELKDEPVLYTFKNKDKRTLSELIWHVFILRSPTFLEVPDGTFVLQCSASRSRTREDLFKVLQARFPLITFQFCHDIVLHLISKNFMQYSGFCGTVHRRVYNFSTSSNVFGKTQEQIAELFKNFEAEVKKYRREHPWVKK